MKCSLKNEDRTLPLPKSGKKIALIGFIGSNAIVHGGGSGSVVPSSIATPLAGVTAVVGSMVTSYNGTEATQAAAVATAADIAVVFVGTYSQEGSDRTSLSLDDGGPANNQNALIEAVAKANPNTVVVVGTPGAILMPWSGSVKSILINFMPGQEAGNAVADVLFGDLPAPWLNPVVTPFHAILTLF